MPTSKSSQYRQRARDVIYPKIAEARELGLNGREIRRYVTKFYPFAARVGFAYKVWLEELDIGMSDQITPGPQLKLFDKINNV